MLFRKKRSIILTDDFLCAFTNRFRRSRIDEYVPSFAVFHINEIGSALQQGFQSERLLCCSRNRQRRDLKGTLSIRLF